MSFPSSLPLFLHPSTNWTNKLSNSFAVVDGQYEAGAPVRPSESSAAAAAAAAKIVSGPSPDHHAVIECPRCNSTNTKFCYYNNYSRSQPRHFCKTCRRYWTHGGALRNVPVGGGSRRSNKQAAKHSKPQTSATTITAADVGSMRPPPLLINNNDNLNHTTLMHNFGAGMAAPPRPCPNPYTSFGDQENINVGGGTVVKKMEEMIGYDPNRLVQFSYDQSNNNNNNNNNNNYNDMFINCGDSGSMSSCIAWPISGTTSTTGFSYGSSSLTFMDSDMP